MSYEYPDHQLHISRYSFDSKPEALIDATVFYNMNADALILCAGRIQFHRETFMEDFESLCADYFYTISDDDVDVANGIASDIMKLVEREYPSANELADFKIYFSHYRKAAEALAESEKNGRTST